MAAEVECHKAPSPVNQQRSSASTYRYSTVPLAAASCGRSHLGHFSARRRDLPGDLLLRKTASSKPP